MAEQVGRVPAIGNFRSSRPNNRPVRGYSGGRSEYDRNRRVNTAANLLAGACVVPLIVGFGVFCLIMFHKSFSQAGLEGPHVRQALENATLTKNESKPDDFSTLASKVPRSSPATTDTIEVHFPAEAVLAGVLFNRRRTFLGRSLSDEFGPCIVVVPAGRCLLVWKGLPPVYRDDFEYLASSAKVVFSWAPHYAGRPWPANAVRVSLREKIPEVFLYGRSPGFDSSSLLAGVIRTSESPRLIVLDHGKVRLFPRYEVLVKLPVQYPNERWLNCMDKCNDTGDAVYGGFEGGVPTLVGRTYFDGSFWPCKVVSIGCVLPGGQVALIFEFLTESAGITYEWIKGTASLAHAVGIGQAVVGRSLALPSDGRMLLGAVLPTNGSRLFASDGRDPLAAPLSDFEILVKRAALSH